MSVKVNISSNRKRVVEIDKNEKVVQIDIKVPGEWIGNNNIAALITSALTRVGFTDIEILTDQDIETVENKLKLTAFYLDGPVDSIQIDAIPKVIINDLT